MRKKARTGLFFSESRFMRASNFNYGSRASDEEVVVTCAEKRNDDIARRQLTNFRALDADGRLESLLEFSSANGVQFSDGAGGVGPAGDIAPLKKDDRQLEGRVFQAAPYSFTAPRDGEQIHPNVQAKVDSTLRTLPTPGERFPFTGSVIHDMQSHCRVEPFPRGGKASRNDGVGPAHMSNANVRAPATRR